MNSKQHRIAASLRSTLRAATNSGVRSLAVPIGAALLITGCMGSGETADLDATELANDDLAEDVLLDGDNDRASMLETPDWDLDEDGEVIYELPIDNAIRATSDFVDIDTEDIDRPDGAPDMGGLVMTDSAGFPEDSAKVLEPSNASNFNTCAATTTGCAIGGKLGGRIACGADLFAVMSGQAELVGPLSYSCYTALFGTAGACIAASGYCGQDIIDTATQHPSPKPPTRYLSEAGSNYSTDTEKSANCPAHERVKKVTVWKQPSGGHYVTQIRLQCTDGTNITYGTKGASDTGAAATCNQDKGKLLSGLRVRHGGWIDAVGGRCQSAGFADVATKSEFGVTNYALWGGTGGTLETFECPKHQYVRGMKAHYRTISSGKVINYVRLHCR